MDRIRISSTTPVIVRRHIRGGLERVPVSQWGPMPARDALSAGHLTTSSGTVSVVVTVAPGHELEGVNVLYKNGRWQAQVDGMAQ